MTLGELEKQIHKEFPKFKVVPKRKSTLMKAIGIFLKVITFGQMDSFMTQFTTTLGYTVYVTDVWPTHSDNARMIILRHERVHMRQRKKYGSFLFSFLYLFFPLPVIFAYYRMKFEKEGYEETMRAVFELLPATGLKTLKSAKFRNMTVAHFTTAEYFWMWPFKDAVTRWYDGVVEKLEKG
jgi:hypothetical protein